MTVAPLWDRMFGTAGGKRGRAPFAVLGTDGLSPLFLELVGEKRKSDNRQSE